MPELENKLAAPEGCAPLTCSASCWCGQDWSKTDLEISQARGISRQAVNQMRRRVKAPNAPKPLKPLNKREALAAAHAMVGEIAHWGQLGVDDFLPEWAQGSWHEFQDRVDALLDRWPNS